MQTVEENLNKRRIQSANPLSFLCLKRANLYGLYSLEIKTITKFPPCYSLDSIIDNISPIVFYFFEFLNASVNILWRKGIPIRTDTPQKITMQFL